MESAGNTEEINYTSIKPIVLIEILLLPTLQINSRVDFMQSAQISASARLKSAFCSIRLLSINDWWLISQMDGEANFLTLK